MKYLSVNLVLIFSLFGCSANSTKVVRPEIFEAVNRSGRAILSGFELGVNLSDYRDKVQDYATELSVVEGKVESDEERAILQQFSEAYEFYKDVLILVEFRVTQGTAVWPGEWYEMYNKGFCVVNKSGQVFGEECIAVNEVIRQHDVETGRYREGSNSYFYNSAQTIDSIMAKASGRIEQATQLLKES